jgi:hypothetical protein
MITIFEEETELGQCPCEEDDRTTCSYGEPELASIYAHTVASLNQNNGVLRIEQHCYLRRGSEVPDQSRIKPVFVVEPVNESRSKNVKFAREMHQQFISRVRNEIPQLV